MREIDDNKCRLSDLGAHDVVDDSGARNIVHVYEIAADPPFHRWLHHFFHEKSEVRVAELHGDKTMLPLESSAFFHLVPFPSGGAVLGPVKKGTKANGSKIPQGEEWTHQ